MLIIGVLSLSYPMVSNYLATKKHVAKVETYEKKVATYSKEDIEEGIQKAVDYNNSLLGTPVKDPFIPGSGVSLPQNYLEVLDEDGVMGHIIIPKIDIDLPIYHGVSEEVLEKGIGHIEGTEIPVGGVGTHAVLSGHTGLPKAKLFTDLIDVEEGDIFYINILSREFAYQVDKIEVVLPDDITKLRTVKGEDYVTLVTCTPYGINTHRLLVRGTRVYKVSKEVAVLKEGKRFYLIVFGISLVIAIIAIIQFRRVSKRCKEEKV